MNELPFASFDAEDFRDTQLHLKRLRLAATLRRGYCTPAQNAGWPASD
jgi:hypothetical protein